MEFISSQSPVTELEDQCKLLSAFWEQLDSPAEAARAATTPQDITSAVARHVAERVEAFVAKVDVVQPVSTAYIDPWLADRASQEEAPQRGQHNTTASGGGSNVDSGAEGRTVAVAVAVFGAAMKRAHFHLSPQHIFLNAASYGATPRAVLQARSRWEDLEAEDPYRFRLDVLPFRLRRVTNRLASFIGAHPADVQLVVNANTATSTVLKSLPWEVGDVFLILACDYDTTKLAARYLSETFGVEILTVDIALPLRDDDVARAVENTLLLQLKRGRPLPRLANFCHITSRTAWIFPVKRMTAVCHSFGIPVMIDGAQVPGHIPLHVADIAAEWYIGTCHKWMFSCPGVAFLVTARSKQRSTKPLAPVLDDAAVYGRDAAMSGGVADYSPFLALEAAFDFVDTVCGGWQSVWRHNSALAVTAVRELTALWNLEAEGLRCVQEQQILVRRDGGDGGGPTNCMPIIPLPRVRDPSNSTAKRLMGQLLAHRGTTCFLLVESFRNPMTNEVRPLLAVRLTCQIHVDIDDIRRFGQAVLDLVAEESSAAATNVATARGDEAAHGIDIS